MKRSINNVLRYINSHIVENEKSILKFPDIGKHFEDLYELFNDCILLEDLEEVKYCKVFNYVHDKPTTIFPAPIKTSNNDRVYVLYMNKLDKRVKRIYVPLGFNSEYWTDLAEYISPSKDMQRIAILRYNDNTNVCNINIKIILGE